MTDPTPDQEFGQLLSARQELDKERAHRREKVWKIFSWSATLLVAITGGTVALKTDPENGFTFSWWLRSVLIASIVFLMAYSSLWIEQNLDIEDKAQEAINECDQRLGIKHVVPSTNPKFGYTAALVMLAIAAIVAVVVDV